MSVIRIVRAREHNLRDVSLDLPKHRLVVVTGVSGSGKSSLVFDTLAAEAQRQLNETFSTFIRNRLPKYGQPAADAIENLSPAIVVAQRRIGGNARSTVGTVTDIHPLLRLLFSRAGQPSAGFSNRYSFNDPEGMCQDCHGTGVSARLVESELLDRSRSLNEGAFRFTTFAVGTWYWEYYGDSDLFDNDKPLGDYSAAEWETLRRGSKAADPLPGTPNDFEGVVDRFNRIFLRKDLGKMSPKRRAEFERLVHSGTCPTCDGNRLNAAALASRIGGHNIAELAALQADELLDVLETVDTPEAASVVESLRDRLGNLVTIGLGYLSLDRPTTTLSGGESQRIKMVRHLGSSLGDMLYIFDEPTAGLHPSDVQRFNQLLRKLQEKGNTVLVVEHDRDVIEIADHVVDVGPGAGPDGGEILYEGPVDGLRRAGTPTGRCMNRELDLNRKPRQATGVLTVANATAHNLRDVTVEFPTGVFTVVSGVAGSGKSSLVNDELRRRYPEVVAIDQSQLSGNSRSTPATYTGLMDEIRTLFATAHGVSPSLFSANSDGACPNCRGLGFVTTELAFMDDLKSLCEECGGKRYTQDVLDYQLDGRNITDVLDLTVGEAAGVFASEVIERVVRSLGDVGLGYLKLGQPLTTLSGGEAQRVKLATELRTPAKVYLMDEPTTGLHMADVDQLLGIVDRLVDAGSTVIAIEHNLDVIAAADWIVDVGPGPGHHGGRILFAGTPEALLDHPDSATAEHLRGALAR
ncbi:ATP-binding cassette domain-containing protein [Kribbella italica]|uniref:UvrABC system protein A n=1 Tax=Kribbella italica TaxID=1540520 RepID=A0A7W9MZM5_9ACTN|nr:excinuclease ABC subunit UvrA [Kribbella italica]MBB5841398.1 excinuclease UvrABC ATPase subunit [Kribbella italica]